MLAYCSIWCVLVRKKRGDVFMWCALVRKEKWCILWCQLYIAIFCHGTSLKKQSGHAVTRTCVAGISSQQTCYRLDHHTSSKKDASSQETLSFPIRPMLFLTLDEWEKTVLLDSWIDASFLGMHDGLEDSMTTDTGDAGSSPHVARWFFSMMFHDKILLCI